MKDLLPVLVVLGLGGVVIYLLTRQTSPPAVYQPTQMCGASYAGFGGSVPCKYLADGIKELAGQAKKVLEPLSKEVSTATSGIKPWEVVVTPVAISHVAYNEGKRALSYINPF